MNNREEILAKSRNENKDKDLYEKEIQVKAGNMGACAAAILATIFFSIQIVVGGGINLGLHAVFCSVPATGYIFKAVNMKRKRDIIVSVIWIAVTLILSIAYIHGLIASSTIL
jgi:hypothetical protein